MSKKIRLQFDFSPEWVARIDALVKRFDASSRAEIVRRALDLLDHVTKDGGQEERDPVIRRDDCSKIKIVLL